MTRERTSSPGQLTLMRGQTAGEQVDYSYDQWRHAQIRQMEQSYDEVTGSHLRKPAAA